VQIYRKLHKIIVVDNMPSLAGVKFSASWRIWDPTQLAFVLKLHMRAPDIPLQLPYDPTSVSIIYHDSHNHLLLLPK